jgi:hypothetical protein
MAQSRELHGFVDEDEQAPEKEREELDWDTIFAYRTMRMVRIQDRYLGLLYYFITSLVVFYVAVFALMISGKHQIESSGVGSVVTKFTGKAFHDGKAYDWVDLRFPETEPAGTFIMTRNVLLKGQKIGKCVDFDQSCPCREGAECVDGYCQDQAWCPSIGEGNVEELSKTATVETMEGLEHTQLEIQAGIAFPRVSEYFFVAGKSKPGATNPLRYISLGDLLKLGDMTVEEFVEYGGIVSVILQWGVGARPCEVILPENCEPIIRVTRLDGGRGFVTKRSMRKYVNGEVTRDASLMYGIRVLVDSAGVGRKTNFVLLMIQAGSCLALMRTASMIADFIMLFCYPAEKTALYYKCKVKETQDFSDLKDRLNIINEHREEVAALLNRGSSRTLGLGAGGRGGMASLILKR